MAITEQQVWVTSKGTIVGTFVEAHTLEVTEQVKLIEDLFINWRDAEFDVERFIQFLQTSPHAKPLMDTLKYIYSQNPVSRTMPDPLNLLPPQPKPSE